ncbi:MAG: hypothetical protein M3N08_02825 [Pseudomonadota bacterium]|nr:hypothetical protein [Pseudomonadota bacterium]
MSRRIFLTVAGAIALAGLNPLPCLATERQDIVAGLDTLPMMVDKISGDVTMAIIFDAAIPASKADADNVKAIVDAGINVPGGGKLSALLVNVNDLAKLSRVRLAFMTTGLAPHFADINLVTSAASVLTVSTDISCVTAGACIIGISNSPKLAIYFNKAAADAAKIEFSQGFAMLVRQL